MSATGKLGDQVTHLSASDCITASKGPSSPFLAIFSLNSGLQGIEGEFFKAATYLIDVMSGPLQVLTAVPVRTAVADGTILELDLQAQQFPRGRYLIVRTDRAFDEFTEPYASASLEVNEVAAKIALLFPGLLADKRFEGFVSTPGNYVCERGGPLLVSGHRDEVPADVAQQLADFDRALSAQSEATRERFRLAARWYAHGQFAENVVDRLLSWFTSLEVHPASNTTDVARAVCDYLILKEFPQIASVDLKSRLQLGRITSMRGDVIHNGRAHLSMQEESEYLEHLKILDAIVRTCLRLLAGLPAAGALDRFIGRNSLT